MSFDGAPTILEELWLPGQVFKGLTAERLVEYKGPMYGLFESEFGTRMIRATEKIRAIGADTTAADLSERGRGPAPAVRRAGDPPTGQAGRIAPRPVLTSHHHYQNDLS